MPSHGIINEIHRCWWWLTLMAPMASIARNIAHCCRFLSVVLLVLIDLGVVGRHVSIFGALFHERLFICKTRNNDMPMNNSCIVPNVNAIGVLEAASKPKRRAKNAIRKKSRTEKCISNRVNLMTSKIKAQNMHATNEIKCVCSVRASNRQ